MRFFYQAVRLKEIMRQNWHLSGRQESVAGHSWFLALMVLTVHPLVETSMKHKIDLLQSLKLALIHDIGEVLTGDIPFSAAPDGSVEREKKLENERIAINKLNDVLREPGLDIYEIWTEYNSCSSSEAKFVKSLDKIEFYFQRSASKRSLNENERHVLNLRLSKLASENSVLGNILKTIASHLDGIVENTCVSVH